VQPAMMGTPEVEHAGVQSNLAAFVLHPKINLKPDDSPDIGVAASGITIKLAPSVARTQTANLLLNELNPPGTRAPRAYNIAWPNNLPADQEETDTLVFPSSEVAAGV